MFKVDFIGRLAVDAERSVENGVATLKLRIADNFKYTNSKGEVVEDVTWASVFYHGKSDNLLPYLTKGTPVYVRGRGSLRVYSSQIDRCMKAGLTINADEINLLPTDKSMPEHVQLHDEEGTFWTFDLAYITTRDGLTKDSTFYDTNHKAFRTKQARFVIDAEALDR